MQILDKETVHITSLVKFFEILDAKYSPSTVQHENWYFRGHDTYDYKLIPSVGRFLGNEGTKTPEDLFTIEKSAFARFEIETYHELKEKNQFIIMAVAQHHGLKTRLLDWSLSPLVALFFAVENEDKHNIDGAIFAHKPNKLPVNILRKENVSPFDIPGEYQYLFIPSISPRINAQSGIFQLFKNPSIPMDKAENLDKLFIPASAKRDLKVDLANAGVTYNSLFPGLDGIAQNLNYRYFNSDF